MHKVIYLTICRISYSRIYFPSDCVSSFFSHLLNGPLFHILLKKIPILLVHTVSFLTARNILRIRVEVRFSHLHNTVQHSFAWRKLLNQLNDFRCSPRSITRVYLCLFGFSPNPAVHLVFCTIQGPATGLDFLSSSLGLLVSSGLGLGHSMQKTNSPSGKCTSTCESWEHLWDANILKVSMFVFSSHVKASYMFAL